MIAVTGHVVEIGPAQVAVGLALVKQQATARRNRPPSEASAVESADLMTRHIAVVRRWTRAPNVTRGAVGREPAIDRAGRQPKQGWENRISQL